MLCKRIEPELFSSLSAWISGAGHLFYRIPPLYSRKIFIIDRKAESQSLGSLFLCFFFFFFGRKQINS